MIVQDRDPVNITDSLVVRYFDRFLGARDPGDAVLDKLSPIKHVDRVDIPVLLIHGRDDTVVPIEQSRRMADALKDEGKQVQSIELPGEDHWLSRGETRFQMLDATIKFLAVNNPVN